MEKLKEQEILEQLEALNRQFIETQYFVDGICPNCLARTIPWIPVVTAVGISTMKTNGINPKNGHKMNCMFST